MINARTLDLLGAAFFMVLGLVLIAMGRELEVSGGNWMVDRGFWPKWIGWLMVVASLVMALQAWRRPGSPVALLPKGATWLMFASIVAFYLLLPLLGYFLASLLWVAALGAISGERSALRLIGFAAAAVVLGYAIFWYVLSVPLPAGTSWTGFLASIPWLSADAMSSAIARTHVAGL